VSFEASKIRHASVVQRLRCLLKLQQYDVHLSCGVCSVFWGFKNMPRICGAAFAMSFEASKIRRASVVQRLQRLLKLQKYAVHLSCGVCSVF